MSDVKVEFCNVMDEEREFLLGLCSRRGSADLEIAVWPGFKSWLEERREQLKGSAEFPDNWIKEELKGKFEDCVYFAMKLADRDKDEKVLLQTRSRIHNGRGQE